MRRTGSGLGIDSHCSHHPGDVVGVHLGRLEHLVHDRLVDPAGDHVGVERVDEGVGLGVVAEEHLLGARPARAARLSSSTGSL